MQGCHRNPPTTVDVSRCSITTGIGVGVVFVDGAKDELMLGLGLDQKGILDRNCPSGLTPVNTQAHTHTYMHTCTHAHGHQADSLRGAGVCAGF